MIIAFLWWSNINLSLPWREGGRTDTLRTGLPSICRVCDSLTLSCEWRVRLSVSAPSSPAPPIATVCHLPALTPANWHWLANSANVKQGLTKADLNLWSEVCFGVWCSNCDFKKRKKQKCYQLLRSKKVLLIVLLLNTLNILEVVALLKLCSSPIRKLCRLWIFQLLNSKQ